MPLASLMTPEPRCLTGLPLAAAEWQAHRALGDSEWHNRALQSRRQPGRRDEAPRLAGRTGRRRGPARQPEKTPLAYP